MAIGVEHEIIILENHIALLKRKGGGSTTQPLYVIESLIARIRELEAVQKPVIPEELAKCLRDLLYGASFFSSAIEINRHVGDVDGEEVEEILRKYFEPKAVLVEEIPDKLTITEHTLSAYEKKEWNAKCSCGHHWYALMPTENCPKCNPKQQPYAYIDDKNRLVKISGHVYFDGGFIDANSEIPDSWKTLVLIEKAGE